jgi:hypothetical protein
MRPAITLLAVVALLLPAAVSAQERDVTRRSWIFLDNRLDVAIIADAPGVLQVVRGERGRIEVAARSRDGFPGFGLGGSHTRQLRLTAVGAGDVQYLVVVPEHVSVRVHLPHGASVSLAPRAPAGTYRWGAQEDGAAERVAYGATDMPAPTTAGGLFVAHAATWAPASVDVPDLTSVRSISVRFEGGDFRVASSRPLAVSPGNRSVLQVDVAGEPLDLVLYVPRGRNTFVLRSGTNTLVQSIAGVPRALCGNVILQNPTEHQTWLTFHPQNGRLECR